jgi:hypothetical protein
MNVRQLRIIASSALALLVASAIVVAEPAGDAKNPGAAAANAPAAQPQMQLPPGWTQADMKAGMEASTPGKQHELLARSVGTWRGKNTMWMYPGAAPVVSESTATVTSVMGGRHIKTQMTGDVPGMGPYTGEGVNGYDNVRHQFVAPLIDNWTTSILNGTVELSPDGKSFTWQLTVSCPITKKPQGIRQVETFTGPNTKTLEMFTADPKTGQEFKMMQIELTRQ